MLEAGASRATPPRLAVIQLTPLEPDQSRPDGILDKEISSIASQSPQVVPRMILRHATGAFVWQSGRGVAARQRDSISAKVDVSSRTHPLLSPLETRRRQRARSLVHVLLLRWAEPPPPHALTRRFWRSSLFSLYLRRYSLALGSFCFIRALPFR